MAERKEVLELIRKALAGPPGSPPPVPPRDDWPPLGGVLAPVPPEQWVETFEAELARVGGVAHRAASTSELEAVLRPILAQAQAASVAISRNPLLAALDLEARLRAWGHAVNAWPAAGEPPDPAREGAYRAACFAAPVGITGADFALVESGSLVLTSATEGSQLVSLAPPVHVALYRRAQVVESLEEVLAQLAARRDPDGRPAGRSVVFITGTSRTADIEQILVRGVHGPGEVHAVLVEESCRAEAVRRP